MSLSRFVATQARAIVVTTALVAGLGLVAVRSLPSSIYPPLQFPRIVVIAKTGTTPARSMMLTVTQPIEQALMEVPGIRRVRSTTFRGASEISAQFAPATDMLVALQQAESKIAETRQLLPAGTGLTVERLTPAAFPVLSLNLTGALPVPDLRDYAYYVIRPYLARVAGVGQVEVLASDSREIEVVADQGRLLAAGLTVHDVASALRATNVLTPVGRYDAGGTQHLVLASSLWASARDIAAVPIVVHDGATLRVRDVADVFPGSPDRTLLITGTHGQPAVAISITQQVGADVLDVRRGVEARLASIAAALPSGLTLSKTYDLAEFVAASVGNVRDAILLGGFLAVVVLLLFLRDWRLTIVASVTLPLTVLATFIVMWMAGQSINLMSMGGLAVAIGLVIDDAVVVVEGIARHLAEGGAEHAVDIALRELVAPVVSSTLTTVVVFVPLGLLSGTAGDFFRALSLTLTSAVLVSLVLALTLIPVLARLFLRARTAASETHVSDIFDRIYARTLPVLLARPVLAGVLALALLGGATAAYRSLGTGFLPETDEGGFVIDYLTPDGTALAETDARLRKVEAVLDRVPEIASYSRRTGSELGIFATQQTKGDVLVRLKPRDQRTRSAAQIIEDLRDRLHDAAPDTEIEFIQLLQDMIGDLEGSTAPIEVKVFGDDAEVLARLSEQVTRAIGTVPGVVDVVGARRDNPETTWTVDDVAAGRLGLTPEEVATELSANWLGEVATDLRLADRIIPVRVRLADAVRFDPARLAQTSIRGKDQHVAPLGGLARVSTSPGQPVLERENLRQMALVTARLENRDLGGAVADVRQQLASIRLPLGYTVEVGGQYESQRRAFGELLLVFGAASALVFLVLVAQFRRFLPSLLILAAAPLSVGGALAVLLATGTDLNVSSAMGLVLLVGLVVKNGIVMLDYAHRLVDEGRPFADAVAAAGRVRLRPILMTTFCTLFGLVPLALGLGAGAELQRPLALAVIGGLALSMLVTLYVVPSLYVALRARK